MTTEHRADVPVTRAKSGAAKRRSTRAEGQPAVPIDGESTLQGLPGIGPSRAQALRKASIDSEIDLLCLLPSAAIDWSEPLTGEALLEAARTEQDVALSGVVERTAMLPMRGRRGVRVTLRSGDVRVELLWFFGAQNAKSLSGEVVVAGVARLDPKRARTVRVIHPRTRAKVDEIEPIYDVAGVPSAAIAGATRSLLEREPRLDLPVSPSDAASTDSLTSILRDVHAPSRRDAFLRARTSLRRTLARVEARWLLQARASAAQALAAQRARRLHRAPARPLVDALMHALQIVPTSSQSRAIAVIGDALQAEHPSHLLLTGDVGSGKTAVIMAAIAQCIASGAQALLLAPTRVLAEQYDDVVSALRTAIPNARIALASVSEKDAKKQAESGDVDLLIGTHVLLSDRVRPRNLGLVVIDEQHRLGVSQRLALARKRGDDDCAPHVLAVSATPIPRSLDLALRGAITTVHLDEKPSGRAAVTTEIRPRLAWPDIESEIAAAAALGESVLVVCSRVGDDDEGVEGRGAALASRLGESKVAVVHGSLDDASVREAVRAFREGRAAVLVGTSIVEIGLDVPNATLIVVDHVERFGLAQLHQLRGRVGRGSRGGRCVLLHGALLTPSARVRLDAMRTLSDGLALAHADLALRGPGDFEGERQSGFGSSLRWLDPLLDEDLLERAATDDTPAGKTELHLLSQLSHARALRTTEAV